MRRYAWRIWGRIRYVALLIWLVMFSLWRRISSALEILKSMWAFFKTDWGVNLRLSNQNLDVPFGSTIRKTEEPWLRYLASHQDRPEARGNFLGLVKEYACLGTRDSDHYKRLFRKLPRALPCHLFCKHGPQNRQCRKGWRKGRHRHTRLTEIHSRPVLVINGFFRGAN